jgi:hypothetical protein
MAQGPSSSNSRWRESRRVASVQGAVGETDGPASACEVEICRRFHGKTRKTMMVPSRT